MVTPRRARRCWVSIGNATRRASGGGGGGVLGVGGGRGGGGRGGGGGGGGGGRGLLLLLMEMTPPLPQPAQLALASIGRGQYAVVHLIIDNAAHQLWGGAAARPFPVLTEGVLGTVYGV